MGELLARCRRRRRCHLQIQVDIAARKLFLEFWNWILTHIRDVRIWDRVSTQNFQPVLSSRVIWPGGPFWKKYKILVFGSHLQEIRCQCFERKHSKIVSAPNVTGSLGRSLGGGARPIRIQYVLKMCIQNLYVYSNMLQNPQKTGAYIYIYIYIYTLKAILHFHRTWPVLLSSGIAPNPKMQADVGGSAAEASDSRLLCTKACFAACLKRMRHSSIRI